jgi:phosphonate transport system substrate-binding protein
MLRHTRAAAAALLTAATVPALAACGGSSDDADGAITFAAVPAESSSSVNSDYANLVALLEKETGRTVEFQNASDYAAVIEGQRAGQIDIASYGPFSYVIAKDSGIDLTPVASPTHDENEAPAYQALAYTRAGSDIKGLEDLKGKTVCLVDAASTSGYLVPMKGLKDAGLTLDEDVTGKLTGGHDASLLALRNGECDAAFAHDTMLSTLESGGQVKEGELTPVWTSDPITEDPIAVNHVSLDDDVIATITEALQTKANKPALVAEGICDSEEECTLPEEIEWGYRPVTDADACKNIG